MVWGGGLPGLQCPPDLEEGGRGGREDWGRWRAAAGQSVGQESSGGAALSQAGAALGGGRCQKWGRRRAAGASGASFFSDGSPRTRTSEE